MRPSLPCSAVLAVALVLTIAGCQSPAASDHAMIHSEVPSTQPTTAQSSTLLAELVASYLSGSFTSAEQAAADADYFEIELHVARIWPDREGATWLYVEQAAASALDRPYRQRVYEVRPLTDNSNPEPAHVVSKVYTLPGDPLRFAGAAAEPSMLDAISPDNLTLREGCAVYLRETENGDFVGSTRGKGCQSSLAGAAYATSTVTLTPNELRSWDQGFNEDGEQVWGAVKGPYVFVRTSESNLR